MTTALSWRSDWECGPAAHTITEMVHGRSVSDAETEVVYAWLAKRGGRLRGAHDLILQLQSDWRHWLRAQCADTSDAHEARRWREASAALMALVDEVRAGVTCGAG